MTCCSLSQATSYKKIYESIVAVMAQFSQIKIDPLEANKQQLVYNQAMPAQTISHAIGTLNEKPLHAALKKWYAQPGDRFEVTVDGFVIDIVRGDLLIEVQTRNFAALKRKLLVLVPHRPVRLVYPIAREKWIVKLARDGSRAHRRKSPKRGVIEHVFEELVSVPQLLANPNFSIEVVFIQEEEIRRYTGGRGWRRKGWKTHERRLLQVVDCHLFETPADMAALIPPDMAEPFTASDIAEALGRPRWLAQKMVYCLREMGALTPAGKRGRAILYIQPGSSI